GWWLVQKAMASARRPRRSLPRPPSRCARNGSPNRIEGHFSYATARVYAGHTDTTGPATTTYIKADLQAVASALAVMTGQTRPSPNASSTQTVWSEAHDYEPSPPCQAMGSRQPACRIREPHRGGC